MTIKNPKQKLSDISASFAATLVAVASLCFSNSYNGEFVFDDSEAIVNNDDVKDGSLANIFKNDFWGTKLSHEQSHKSYRPLTVLTFRLHYSSRGYLEPLDFHTFNVLLHVVVSVVVMFVFKLFLTNNNRNNVAFYAATLFAVHPVHAEAVAGIVGRADMLCALFMWFSVIFYNLSLSSTKYFNKLMNTTISMICIAISMLCKETGITAIAICFVYDLVVVNKILPIDIAKLFKFNYTEAEVKSVASKYKDFILRFVVLCATAIILLILRFGVMGFSTPVFQPVDNPASFLETFVLRVLNYNYVYSINAWLLLCPEWLCFDWAMGCIPLISGPDKRIVAVVALWLFLISFLFYVLSNEGSKLLSDTIMGLVLLIVPFLPATNVFFNVGFVLAERTLYVPSAGFCLLVALGFQRLMDRFGSKKLFCAIYAALIFVMFVRSWVRSEQWKTEKTLFRSALSVCPLNAKVHYNIAKNAADLGNPYHAEIEYNEALRLNPVYAQAMNNLGNLLKDQEKYSEAEKLFRKAVELQKDFAAAWMNFGIVLAALNKHEESEKSYLTALTHRPKYPDCFYNLGVLYLELKRFDEALRAWENATRLKPDHKRAWTNTILLLDDLGQGEKALTTANKALKYLPEEASIYFNMGNILGKAGRFTEAEKYFENAILRDATNPNFFTNLGVLYHRWKKHDAAAKMYKKALEIKPSLQSARENLKKLKTSVTNGDKKIK